MKTWRAPDDAELAYEEFGAGGRPLVLLHGWTGFAADFAPHAEAFGAERRVLVPDLRGHGASARFADVASIGFDRLVEDLVAFLEEVVGEPPHLLGHSMGGMVAIRAALDPRVRLASLLCMDTSASAISGVDEDALAMAEKIAAEQGMDALATVLRNLESGADRRTPAARAHEAAWGERYWAWRAARLGAMDPAAYGPFVRAMRDQESFVPRLTGIGVPTLVLVGSQDRPFLQPSAILAREIPGAHLSIVPHAAHQPQFEAPGRWRDAIDAHLVRAETARV